MSANLDAVRTVALHFGALIERVVFLGGAITELLITHVPAPRPRPTKDVDVAIEVASPIAYLATLRDELRAAGFAEDTSEGAPLCRWTVDGITVDVMPSRPDVLGFTNRWYAAAIASAVWCSLPDVSIRLVTAPYFIGTKLEAFRGRGKEDYQASHDLEDVIAVVYGREELVDELQLAPDDLRSFVADQMYILFSREDAYDIVAGHLPGDATNHTRTGVVMTRLEALARL